jgi:hypothetical protein
VISVILLLLVHVLVLRSMQKKDGTRKEETPKVRKQTCEGGYKEEGKAKA